ncbi:MAG: hypothetical protein V1816_19220 [Pseudomonadota bacterium]
MKKHALIVGLCLMLALVLGACAGPEKKTTSATPVTIPAGPEWVMKGSGAFDVGDRQVFYGVGVASGIKNRALLISTSDNRARAEIAKTLDTYVAYLSKDYMAATSSGEQAVEEQHVEQALKTFSKRTLAGVKIVDRWQDPVEGSMYSLAEYDLEGMKRALANANDLDQQLREHVKENADKLHGQLEELEKRQ